MSERIKQEKVDLDYDNVQQFFQERGKGKVLGNKYNYVLYQDDCPELAIKRDEQEKGKISKILELKSGQRVLDIGCGIGRWGEYLLEQGLVYVGIDASSNMIDMAKKNLENYEAKTLLVGTFQEFLKKLEEAGEELKFDKVFVNGVFMYLNDTDYEQALRDIFSVCNEHCELYVKESMGIEERLTLRQIYSESLTQNYSAIYRSIKEYRDSLGSVFSESFELIEEGYLYDDELKNRKETTDYYMIWRA